MNQRHWEDVYSRKAADQVSWFQPHLERSLQFVDQAKLTADAAIIDVGGGASTFVDDLLARGFSAVTVVDLSARALEIARARLGDRGASVQWVVGDITTLELPEHRYDFWHDRAVFHFLTDPLQRARYVELVRKSLKPGGRIVVATFSPDGPTRCSGLDVTQYSEGAIHAVFGADFAPLGCVRETHHTPSGSSQEFLYCECRLRPDATT